MSVEGERLLRWVSESGRGSWRAFKDACEWVFAPPQHSGAVAAPTARIAGQLSDLGHVEFDWDSRVWAVTAPTLVTLPAAGMTAVLTGARTEVFHTLLERLREGDFPFGVDIGHRDAAIDPVPAVFVSVDEWEALEAVAEELNGSVVVRGADRLAAALPPLQAYLQLLKPFPVAPEAVIDRFHGGTRDWEPAARVSGDGLYRTRDRIRGTTFRLVREGIPYKVDRAIGIYAELARCDESVLAYVPRGQTGELCVDVTVPMPTLHARAAAMCIGLLPDESALEGVGTVFKYYNVPRAVAEDIAASLQQPLPIHEWSA